MSTLDLPSGDFEIADLFSDDQIITLTGETTLYDDVSKPAHYNLTDGIECIAQQYLEWANETLKEIHK